MDGIVNLFKPQGITSHGGVSFLRKTLGIKRIGHTGTLDPNVSGVLALCVGKATRISEYIIEMDKEYIAEITLGIATDTQDGTGQVINFSDKIVKEADIIKAISQFKGNISQVPPMYSALKHQGRKLYELAREGKVIERKPREAKIHEIEILNIEDNKAIFRVSCSKGTYIRTLCDDIGKVLGTYGYMSYLQRTKVGDFKIQDSLSMEYLQSIDKRDMKEIIIPMDKAIEHLEKIDVPDALYQRLINGALLPINHNDDKNITYRIYCKNQFIGIGRVIDTEEGNFLKMDKVLV